MWLVVVYQDLKNIDAYFLYEHISVQSLPGRVQVTALIYVLCGSTLYESHSSLYILNFLFNIGSAAESYLFI